MARRKTTACCVTLERLDRDRRSIIFVIKVYLMTWLAWGKISGLFVY